MKSLLHLLIPVILLASARGQEAHPLPEPNVMAQKAMLRFKQQEEFMNRLSRQKRLSMMLRKDALLLVREQAERANYPGNAYGKALGNKAGWNPWLLILKDANAVSILRPSPGK